MYRPLSLALGLRYIRAKRKNQFISFISLISIIGITLGVAVLIIVLSVMNGFDFEIKTRILSMVPQVTVTNYNRKVDNWQDLAKKIKKNPKVEAVAPFVSSQAMLQNHGMTGFGYVQGIDPILQNKISPIEKNMTKGKLSDLNKSRFGIILGDELAQNVGVSVGDKVTIIVPEFSSGPIGMVPRLKQFTVVGLFHSGYQYDSAYAYISLKDAQILNGMQNSVSGVEIKSTDLYYAPTLANDINKIPGLYATSWVSENAAFFQALKMEKIMMMLILILIIAVAAFNMLSSLVMLVVDKSSDIAILMTIGMTRRTITQIFMIQGMMVGAIGIIFGLILGVIISYNVTDIVAWIQQLLGVQFLSSNIYYINYLPSKIEGWDLISIAVIAFILSFLATIYPAWRASRINPVEALRYE